MLHENNDILVVDQNVDTQVDVVSVIELPVQETPKVEKKINNRDKRKAKQAKRATQTKKSLKTAKSAKKVELSIPEQRRQEREHLNLLEESKKIAISTHIDSSKLKPLNQSQEGVRQFLNYCLNTDDFYSLNGIGEKTLSVREIVKGFDRVVGSRFSNDLNVISYLKIAPILRLFQVIYHLSSCPCSDAAQKHHYFASNFLLRDKKIMNDSGVLTLHLKNNKMIDKTIVDVTPAMKSALKRFDKSE